MKKITTLLAIIFRCVSVNFNAHEATGHSTNFASYRLAKAEICQIFSLTNELKAVIGTQQQNKFSINIILAA